MEEPRYPVPPEATRAFTEVAHSARMNQHMLAAVGDSPPPGSNFALADELYPFEKVSVRARHYVRAALEHLIMWADFAAPLKFHPEQAVQFTSRPAHALARAALESAAQAVWLVSTNDPRECIRRHLSLIRWDLAEYRRSKPDPEHKELVRKRDEELVKRVASSFAEDEIRPPQGYLWVIQQACAPQDLNLDATDAERLWRAASGAAHGMYWTNLELAIVERGAEYEPGHYRTLTRPDPQAMAEMLRASSAVTTYATLKYLDWSRADIQSLIDNARAWLASVVPLKDGVGPEVRARLASGEPVSLAPDEDDHEPT